MGPESEEVGAGLPGGYLMVIEGGGTIFSCSPKE